mgnify:CR=1 FL=1
MTVKKFRLKNSPISCCRCKNYHQEQNITKQLSPKFLRLTIHYLILLQGFSFSIRRGWRAIDSLLDTEKNLALHQFPWSSSSSEKEIDSNETFGRDLFPCLRIRLDEGRLGMKNDTERAPGPVSRKSPKLFGRISGDIILFVSSKRRRLEARNCGSYFNFYSLYNLWKEQL